jgi:hypothetical protein
VEEDVKARLQAYHYQSAKVEETVFNLGDDVYVIVNGQSPFLWL